RLSDGATPSNKPCNGFVNRWSGVQISHPAPVNQTLRRKIDPRSSRAVSQKLSCVSTFPIAPAAQHDKNATWSGLDADTTL
ncbi:MAG: hypothetical protein WBV66_10610, partial [Pseudolabrys sp.]